MSNPSLVRSNLESTARGLIRNDSDLARIISFEALPLSGYLEKSILPGKPVPVAARSKAWVCGRSPAETVGSNPTGGMDVFLFESCVLSGRGLCDGLITRPEESYRLWCVVVYDLEKLVNEEDLAAGRAVGPKEKKFVRAKLNPID